MYISWSSGFALYLEDYLMYEHHILGLWSIWPTFDLKINVGDCDLYFMVQWFCLTSWRLFDVWTSLFGIMSPYDPKFDLKINVDHCDVYFMVQWFCVVSWRLFYVWRSYFGIIGQYDLMFDLKINVGQCDLYFVVQWFWLIYLKTIWCISIWDFESVWPEVWPKNKCRSLWWLFHGPVILPYILKTVWCMNIILWDYGSVWQDIWPQNKCRSLWPIFHSPVILSYISKTIWMMSHIFR